MSQIPSCGVVLCLQLLSVFLNVAGSADPAASGVHRDQVRGQDAELRPRARLRQVSFQLRFTALNYCNTNNMVKQDERLGETLKKFQKIEKSSLKDISWTLIFPT